MRHDRLVLAGVDLHSRDTNAPARRNTDCESVADTLEIRCQLLQRVDLGPLSAAASAEFGDQYVVKRGSE